MCVLHLYNIEMSFKIFSKRLIAPCEKLVVYVLNLIDGQCLHEEDIPNIFQQFLTQNSYVSQTSSAMIAKFSNYFSLKFRSYRARVYCL